MNRILIVVGTAFAVFGALLWLRRSSAIKPVASADSAFAQVQARGAEAMGVDQYTSRHRFEPLEDGGLIVLARDTVDAAGVATIRAHMKDIEARFARGDFQIPEMVHAQAVPGTAAMAAAGARITYTADTVPGGGSLRIRATDPEVVKAVHEFLAFQRMDHRVH